MKKIKLLIASLAAISFCSCSDFLDSTPKGTMTEDKFFLSPDAGYSTVVKCYDMLGDAIGYEIPRMMLYNIATDDSEKGGSDASDRHFGKACIKLLQDVIFVWKISPINLW